MQEQPSKSRVWWMQLELRRAAGCLVIAIHQRLAQPRNVDVSLSVGLGRELVAAPPGGVDEARIEGLTARELVAGIVNHEVSRERSIGIVRIGSADRIVHRAANRVFGDMVGLEIAA